MCLTAVVLLVVVLLVGGSSVLELGNGSSVVPEPSVEPEPGSSVPAGASASWPPSPDPD